MKNVNEQFFGWYYLMAMQRNYINLRVECIWYSLGELEEWGGERKGDKRLWKALKMPVLSCSS